VNAITTVHPSSDDAGEVSAATTRQTPPVTESSAQTAETPSPREEALPRPPSGACEGFIDFIGKNRTFGWAWCRAEPERPVDVEIRIDDQAVVVVRADRFRPDLARAGVGSGYHGFDATLPEPLSAEEKHRVSAYVLTAPGQPEVRLINRAIGETAPRAARAAAEGDRGIRPAGAGAAACSQQLRPALNQILQAQKGVEASLSGLVEDVRHLSQAQFGVDNRAELALAKANDQLNAVQEVLARQTAALELIQLRLDAVAAQLTKQDPVATQRSGGDRPLYWAVGMLAATALGALIFGIFSLAL
jgi:hypothetical protein